VRIDINVRSRRPWMVLVGVTSIIIRSEHRGFAGFKDAPLAADRCSGVDWHDLAGDGYNAIRCCFLSRRL
jgi:hypothetical protein